MRSILLAGLMAATVMTPATPAFAREGDGPRDVQLAQQDNEGHGGQHWGNRDDRGQRQGDNRGGARPQNGPQPDGGPRGNWRGPDVPRPDMQRPQPAPPAPMATGPVATGQGRPDGNRGEWRGEWRGGVRGGPDGRPDGNPGAQQNQGWRGGERPDGDRRGGDRRNDWNPDRGGVAQPGRDWRNDGSVRPPNNGWRDNGAVVQPAPQLRRDWRNDRNEQRPGWNDQHRDRGDDRRTWDNRRFNDRDRWADTRRWDNGWRNDRRYDWRGYRESHRYAYRMPRYYAPYGWSYGYRRFSIGIYLDSLLFGSSYWIDDPWQYRLPPAYGPLRWVRYYDDALLVDTRDGYVVDVIYDFFW